MTTRITPIPRIILAAAIVAAGILFMAPKPVDARIRMSPPKFDYVVYPGDTVKDVVKLVNDSNQDIELVPAVLNFTAKDDDETSGSPETYPADEVRTGTEVATWIELGQGTVFVPARGRANFPFTITVPEDASPGGHFGVIELSINAPGTDPGVGVTASTGSLVFVRVEGEVTENLNIDRFEAQSHAFSHLPVDFDIRLQNQGNAHLRPVGHVFIEDMFGRQVAALSVNSQFQTVLPGYARRFGATWTKGRVPDSASELKKQLSNFAIGRHTATLFLSYGTSGQTVSKTFDFVVMPWQALGVWAAGIVMLVILLILAFKLYNKIVIARYRKKQAKEQQQE